ncbi:hypothetical protein MKMG_02208 [Methanogenium sp. MK-MG]|nr:hypothetical protein MKMG_02208 [Methanogenium sp. MK-MG]
MISSMPSSALSTPVTSNPPIFARVSFDTSNRTGSSSTRRIFFIHIHCHKGSHEINPNLIRFYGFFLIFKKNMGVNSPFLSSEPFINYLYPNTSRNNRHRKSFVCECCGYSLHADLIGARNIESGARTYRYNLEVQGAVNHPHGNYLRIESQAPVFRPG